MMSDNNGDHDEQMRKKQVGREIREASILEFGIPYTLLMLIIASLAIASCVILVNNWNADCDAVWLSLSAWLLVYFILQILYLVVGCICGFYRTTRIGSMAIIYSIIVKHSLLIIWCIIGAIALFGYSSECQTVAYSLWAMTLSVLIIELILICILLLVGCCIVTLPCSIGCCLICTMCCCPSQFRMK